MADDTPPTTMRVAEYMVSELNRYGRLPRERIAYLVRTTYGEAFVVKDRKGEWIVSPVVLRSFRALTGPGVVWERGRQVWRRRRPTDPEGARVVA